MTLALVAWFYFATVDYETVWMWGPFATRVECELDLQETVPVGVETTGCKLMAISQEGDW